MADLKGIRVPHNATLEEAACACADHFLLFAPAGWDDLHAKARQAGFLLVPSLCEKAGCPSCRPGSEALEHAAPRIAEQLREREERGNG